MATGWNDIDRRCDDYLAWLDNQRSKRIFINDGFAQISLLTTGIFAALDTGRRTVSLVALALGFGQNIYNSYENRILVAIEGSTVETLVITRRLTFRDLFADVPIRVKPDAVRVLRDYLRLCTPYAIKMSVNTYSRARATNDIPIEMQEAQMLRQSLIESAIRDINAPLRPPPRVKPIVDAPAPDIAQRVGQQERVLTGDEIQKFQAVVCVKVDGRFTVETRTATLKYLNEHDKDQSQKDRITATDRDTMLDAFDASGGRPC